MLVETPIVRRKKSFDFKNSHLSNVLLKQFLPAGLLAGSHHRSCSVWTWWPKQYFQIKNYAVSIPPQKEPLQPSKAHRSLWRHLLAWLLHFHVGAQWASRCSFKVLGPFQPRVSLRACCPLRLSVCLADPCRLFTSHRIASLAPHFKARCLWAPLRPLLECYLLWHTGRQNTLTRTIKNK